MFGGDRPPLTSDRQPEAVPTAINRSRMKVEAHSGAVDRDLQAISDRMRQTNQTKASLALIERKMEQRGTRVPIFLCDSALSELYERVVSKLTGHKGTNNKANHDPAPRQTPGTMDQGACLVGLSPTPPPPKGTCVGRGTENHADTTNSHSPSSLSHPLASLFSNSPR